MFSSRPQRTRSLRFQSLEHRHLLAGERVGFEISARDLETDVLIGETPTDMGSYQNEDGSAHYVVTEGDRFKIELAAADLRGRARSEGIFRVAADFLFSQQGVLEPAIGESQVIRFPVSILGDGPDESLYFGFSDQPELQVLVDASWLAGDNDRQFERRIAELLVQTHSDITSVDDVEVDVAVNSALGEFVATIVFRDESFIHQDFAGIEVGWRFTRGGFEVTQNDVREPNGEFNPKAILPFLEMNSRNANGIQLYGVDRRFTSGFGSNGFGFDVLSETGGLGPIGRMTDYFPGWSGDVYYDVFSIPVRAVKPTSGLQVSVQPVYPSATSDGNLLYGDDPYGPFVQEGEFLLNELSRFTMDVLPLIPPETVHIRLDEWTAGPVTVFREDDHLVVVSVLDRERIVDQPLYSVRGLVIHGRDDFDDRIHIDHSQGPIVLGEPDGLIVVRGGGGTDFVRVIGFEDREIVLSDDVRANELFRADMVNAARVVARDSEQFKIETSGTASIREADFRLKDAQLVVDSAGTFDLALKQAFVEPPLACFRGAAARSPALLAA